MPPQWVMVAISRSHLDSDYFSERVCFVLADSLAKVSAGWAPCVGCSLTLKCWDLNMLLVHSVPRAHFRWTLLVPSLFWSAVECRCHLRGALVGAIPAGTSGLGSCVTLPFIALSLPSWLTLAENFKDVCGWGSFWFRNFLDLYHAFLGFVLPYWHLEDLNMNSLLTGDKFFQLFHTFCILCRY